MAMPGEFQGADWADTFANLTSTSEQWGNWFDSTPSRPISEWYASKVQPWTPTIPSSGGGRPSSPQVVRGGGMPMPELPSFGSGMGSGMLGRSQVGQLDRWQPRVPLEGFTTFAQGLQNRIARDNARKAAEAAAAGSGGGGGNFAGGGGGNVGKGTGLGDFDKDPSVYGEIERAAEANGVPANFLKVIIAKESSGRWSGGNLNPVWVPSHSPQLGLIHGYIGVFKGAAESRGYGQLWEQARGNRALQIDLLAKVLRSQLADVQKQNPAYSWINVAAYHYSGDPSGNKNPAGWEKHGTTRDYMAKTKAWWEAEDRATKAAGGVVGGGNIGTGGPGGQMVSGMGGIWGGGNMPITQEFGNTQWARDNPGMYAYSKGYGMTGHPGLDIGTPLKTRLFSPGPGVVTCAGTNVGDGGGTGCSNFNSDFRDKRTGAVGRGPGQGRLQINLDNGHIVILGHSYSTNVPLGTRVKAGDFVGLSGTANGQHIHLEYRIPDSSLPEGYRIVDPRQYIKGGLIPGGGGHSGGDGHNHGGSAPAPSGGNFFADQFRQWWQ